MDIGAYLNIDNFGAVARKNGIEVPRERGYRYMKKESRISEEDIQTASEKIALKECEHILRQCGHSAYEYSSRTDRLIKKYLIKRNVSDPNGFEYETIASVKWDAIHGKLRKKLKFAVKKAKAKERTQLEMFNHYVGREDVLYIHARIGGWNWINYGGLEIEKQPWFLGKVDDAYDDTYCDIYAKIDPETINILISEI